MDIAQLREDIAKFDGEPPYDHLGNFCYHRKSWRRCLEEEHGKSIEELRKIVERQAQSKPL